MSGNKHTCQSLFTCIAFDDDFLFLTLFLSLVSPSIFLTLIQSSFNLTAWKVRHENHFKSSKSVCNWNLLLPLLFLFLTHIFLGNFVPFTISSHESRPWIESNGIENPTRIFRDSSAISSVAVCISARVETFYDLIGSCHSSSLPLGIPSDREMVITQSWRWWYSVLLFLFILVLFHIFHFLSQTHRVLIKSSKSN